MSPWKLSLHCGVGQLAGTKPPLPAGGAAPSSCSCRCRLPLYHYPPSLPPQEASQHPRYTLHISSAWCPGACVFLHRLGEPCGPIHPDTRNDNRMGECDNVCLRLGALLWPLELSFSPIFLNLCYGIASNPVSKGRNSDRTHVAGPQDEGPSHSSERPPPHLEPQEPSDKERHF